MRLVLLVPLAEIGRRHEQGNQDSVLAFPHYFLGDPLGDYLL